MKRIVSLALALFLLISIVPPLDVSATQNENARYGERTEVTVIKSETVVKDTKVAGQLEGGYSFPTGGGMYVSPNAGGLTSISLTVPWTVVSFSIAPGSISGVYIAGGVLVNFPENSNYYHVYGRRTYVVEYVYVEEYRGVELINSYYMTRHRLVSTQWRTVEV